MLKILIVASDYYSEVYDLLLDGAQRVLYNHDVKYDVVLVSGALELSSALAFSVMSDRNRYDGYLAMGCVIKGQTDHYRYVCDNAMRTLCDVAVQHAVPLTLAVITAQNMALALERANKMQKDVGGHAARALMRLINLRNALWQ